MQNISIFSKLKLSKLSLKPIIFQETTNFSIEKIPNA